MLRRRLLLGGLLALSVAGRARAQDDAADSTVPDDKPFAAHHIALQLSDREASKRALVISVANNLLKAYGPDNIAIEVVAFGPGIDMLRADSPDRVAVDSLVAQGVRFDICLNTVETVERETGRKVPVNPHAHGVVAGVAQLLLLAEHGYTIVRP
jgi:intracellular sulfur oxidation DsrE/DsrF family protein